MKNKFKQLFAGFLAVLMLAGAMPEMVYAATDKEIPPVFHDDDDNTNVRLVIGKTQEVTIGKTSTISFQLKNESDEDWSSVKVWIEDEWDYKEYYEYKKEDDSEAIHAMTSEYPFEYTESLNKAHEIGGIKKGATKNVNLRVNMKKNLKEGYYPVMIRITTKTGTGDDYTTADYTKTVIVWAKMKTDGKPDEEDETGTEPVAFQLGEGQTTPQGQYQNVMDFAVNVRNSGYKNAYDVRVELEISEDGAKFPFEINEGNYDRWMGTVNSGQTISVPYSMAIRQDTRSGYYPLKFKIKYREEENGNFAAPIEDVFYVHIIGKDNTELDNDAGENERTKARIIVESFETIPETILAGDEFTLKVKMKNASNNISASNILFTFDPEMVSDSPVFTTPKGSNSVVVNSMGPGGTAELVMHFSSNPGVEQRSYTVTIGEQYDSPEFKNAKESVKIAIPLKQQARLNTGTMEIMPDSIKMGSESNVMTTINNTGKVMLYNLSVKFEADSIQTTDAYVGNIKPGESGNVDVMISGTAPTMDDGKVKMIISYEDENGEVSEVVKDFTLFVTEPEPDMPFDDSQIPDGMGVDEEPEKKKVGIWIPVAIVAAAGLVTVIVIRNKKKKAGMDDEIL